MDWGQDGRVSAHPMMTNYNGELSGRVADASFRKKVEKGVPRRRGSHGRR